MGCSVPLAGEFACPGHKQPAIKIGCGTEVCAWYAATVQSGSEPQAREARQTAPLLHINTLQDADLLARHKPTGQHSSTRMSRAQKRVHPRTLQQASTLAGPSTHSSNKLEAHPKHRQPPQNTPDLPSRTRRSALSTCVLRLHASWGAVVVVLAAVCIAWE